MLNIVWFIESLLMPYLCTDFLGGGGMRDICGAMLRYFDFPLEMIEVM
jgi:hypothetical protein